MALAASEVRFEFSTALHWVGAVDGPVECIAVFGPHDERTHLA